MTPRSLLAMPSIPFSQLSMPFYLYCAGSSVHAGGRVPTLTLPGVAALVRRTPPPPLLPAAALPHPNTCLGIGEITLYTRELGKVVSLLSRVGVPTHKGKSPKELPGGAHKVAKYFFGSTRVLITGPAADLTSDADAPPPPIPQMSWMFGTNTTSNAMEITGWLPVVEEISAVTSACPAAGAPKKALQEGRSIATLKRGAVPNLTGTFAFLGGGDAGNLNLT